MQPASAKDIPGKQRQILPSGLSRPRTRSCALLQRAQIRAASPGPQPSGLIVPACAHAASTNVVRRRDWRVRRRRTGGERAASVLLKPRITRFGKAGQAFDDAGDIRNAGADFGPRSVLRAHGFIDIAAMAQALTRETLRMRRMLQEFPAACQYRPDRPGHASRFPASRSKNTHQREYWRAPRPLC